MNHVLYMDIAKTISKYSCCLRRKYGAVIVKDGKILSLGYNNVCKQDTPCNTPGVGCYRQQHNIPSGERYELCQSIHAEQNAIISCKEDMTNAILYLYGVDVEKEIPLLDAAPCMLCRRFMIEAGITTYVNPRLDIKKL